MSNKVIINAEGIEMSTAVKWEPLDQYAFADIMSGATIKRCTVFDGKLYMLCAGRKDKMPLDYSPGNVFYVMQISANGGMMEINRAIIPELMTEAFFLWCNNPENNEDPIIIGDYIK